MGRELKIMFCGPSGTGKTTMAKEISKLFNIPFISGSYSDLVPSTKSEPHEKMITKSTEEIYNQDYQLINLRRNQLKDLTSFVSDRSFVDNAAYFIDKLAHRIPQCEVETYLDISKKLSETFTTHLIMVPFTKEIMGKWEIEDNHKRVLNKYYQYKISNLMMSVIQDFIYPDLSTEYHLIRKEYINKVVGNDKTKILFLYELDRVKRIQVINEFLNL